MNKLRKTIEKHPLGMQLANDPLFRLLASSSASAGWDVLYALFNIVLGFFYQSFWFVAMAAYYTVLGGMETYAVIVGRKAQEETLTAISRRCGIGMFLLAITVSGVVCAVIAETRNASYHMIVMIALAAYAFYAATLAIVGAVRARKRSRVQRILRKLSLASMIGSMLSLEFSMLGTFGNPADASSTAIEAASGAVAVIVLLVLGLMLIRQSGRIDGILEDE